jgi:hypothetical protein
VRRHAHAARVVVHQPHSDVLVLDVDYLRKSSVY